MQRNSNYPFILPSSTNPWTEIHTTCKLDNNNNLLSAFNINSEYTMLVENDFDTENEVDSDIENDLDKKQRQLNTVLEKVRFY